MWGNRRISLVRQTTFSECGLCCISMVGSYFGFHKPIRYAGHGIYLDSESLLWGL